MNDWSEFIVGTPAKLDALTQALNLKQYYKASKIASEIACSMIALTMWIAKETLNKGRE